MSALSETMASRKLADADLAWRIVGLTNLYRLLAVLVLLAIYAGTQPTPVFGSAAPHLFRVALLTYFVLAAVLALVGRRFWPGRRSLVLTHALIDAYAIAVLTYASGGVASNLAMLLVIPVGSHGAAGRRPRGPGDRRDGRTCHPRAAVLPVRPPASAPSMTTRWQASWA